MPALACSIPFTAWSISGLEKPSASAPSHVGLADRLVSLGNDFQPGGQGSFRMTWWFEVTRKVEAASKLSLQAYPDGVCPQPEHRASEGYLDLDHFPKTATSTWKPGTIVRHVFSGRAAPGPYRFQFGFVEPEGS